MIALLLIAVALGEDCTRCHTEAVEQFTSTRHAQAFFNPTFQAAWRRSGDPWCLTCHAPEGSGQVGVGCASCHETGELSDEEPHHPGMIRVPTVKTCLRCHQFTAPDSNHWVQTTGEEYHASGLSQTCSDCHMDGHRLLGARDQAFVRASVQVRLDTTEATPVLVFTTKEVAHRVPTGDRFRQLVVETLSEGELVWRRRLARWVTGVGEGFHEVADLRLPGSTHEGPGELRVTLAGEPAERWRVRFVLADPLHTELEEVEREWTLAEGALPEVSLP